MISAELATLISPLLGKRYRPGGTGPDEFDCGGLVQYVQRLVFEREFVAGTAPVDLLPLTRFIAKHPERRNWRRCERPVHGGLVEMGHNDHAHHIGQYLDLDGGGVLHAHAKAGVSWDSLLMLRAAGWRGFVYLERAN